MEEKEISNESTELSHPFILLIGGDNENSKKMFSVVGKTLPGQKYPFFQKRLTNDNIVVPA